MSRSVPFAEGYTPFFSGHETFPLRYGWLKKAFDAVVEEGRKDLFTSDDAIARFGVGKNMVASIRHWATHTGIIEEVGDRLRATNLGRELFDPESGLDPFMEHPSTLWLLHWHLAGNTKKTTWYWAFNQFSSPIFKRSRLVDSINKLATSRGWARAVKTTLRNDVACFIRTYVTQGPSSPGALDDSIESPLAELGLIKATSTTDEFRFVRGPKPTLGQGTFAYALLDFWRSQQSAATLSFESVAHQAGSPGRVFLLEENEVADRLADLDRLTDGALSWSESAGLRQVVRNIEFDAVYPINFIEKDYKTIDKRKAA
ncbi:MAG: DUF4007 family protein [Planctomycetes bacterium]|nr:DUF4007 family protein [Planctomycetota bacterium]